MTLPDPSLQKLASGTAVSSVLRLCWTLLGVTLLLLAPISATAHETRPAIAEMSVSDEQVSLVVTLTLEAPLAGINLDGLNDTDEAPQADAYDALRALPPHELEPRLRAAWPDLARLLDIRTGSQRLDIALDSVRVPDTEDASLPRDSVLGLSALLPPGTEPVTFAWDESLGPVILREARDSPDAYAAYLQAGETSAPFPRQGEVASESLLESFARYVVVGFEHIIPKGLDHILFVLGLFFFSARLGPLLWQVSAFTLAHTVTLALATFGLVTLSPNIVEPLIALSIAYVGFENVFARKMTFWRPALVFAFGLLHGLGFASVLGDVGLSSGHAALSLIAFNIGVEVGQLAVIALAFVLVGYWFGSKPWYRQRIAIPASVVIGSVGFYWFLERTGLIAI